MTVKQNPAIRKLTVAVYQIPTDQPDQPESDGTLTWDSTTLVLVEVEAGNQQGLGYTYANAATATLIRDQLQDVIIDSDALAVDGNWLRMVHAIRNQGRPGIASMAIAAVDSALWDLKAKLLDVPLVTLLGSVHEGVDIYGSGGFTSYTDSQLQEQLGAWVEQGIPRVKMKVGREPDRDVSRAAQAARAAIGKNARLFVDANGAYSRKQAMALSLKFAEQGVSWFEEPVSSDDLEGLHWLRDHSPAGMDITAGEYGYDLTYFRRMLAAGAVDVLMADATRCAGITGFLQAATLAQAFQVPLSAHCAPSLHLHPGCAVGHLRHMEYFHDHVRIEHMLFDGAARPRGGQLFPDRSRAGLGLELKRKDAEQYAL